MAEEFARCAVHAIRAAAEIHFVEIEFEDLLLRKLRLQRHRQHPFAQFAVKRAIGIEEDVARQLLRDGAGRAGGFAVAQGYIHRAPQTDGIDPEMRPEPAILHRDHRVFHDGRDLPAVEPFAVARAKLDDLAAVAGANHDRLAALRRFQFGIAGQGSHCEQHCQAQKQRAQQRPENAGQKQSPQPQPPSGQGWLAVPRTGSTARLSAAAACGHRLILSSIGADAAHATCAIRPYPIIKGEPP